MAMTLTDSSPPDYTVDFGGDARFVLNETTEKTYKMTTVGLPYDFDLEIDKDEAETGGNIDPTKVMKWIIKKAKEYICPSCK